MVVVFRKTSLRQQGTDAAFWRAQSYQARIDTLEEIRRDYQAWVQSSRKESGDVQPGFQRVYRIVKR